VVEVGSGPVRVIGEDIDLVILVLSKPSQNAFILPFALFAILNSWVDHIRLSPGVIEAAENGYVLIS